MRFPTPLTGLVVIAGAALALPGGAASAGPPLTKEQYFNASRKFTGAVSGTLTQYSDISANEYPPAKCARKVRRLHGRLGLISKNAHQVVPPAEVRVLHERLIAAGETVVRRIGKTVRPAARGTLVCGFEEQPAVADRLYDIYISSSMERTIDKLADRGYFFVPE